MTHTRKVAILDKYHCYFVLLIWAYLDIVQVTRLMAEAWPVNVCLRDGMLAVQAVLVIAGENHLLAAAAFVYSVRQVMTNSRWE